MSAYYNEIDPAAAAMLRGLIAAGQIAPGIVDERSIEDVRPDELAGYAQCHFFAGIGIWSLALRQAGIPDDYRVWSMSCPCQPFSAAGKGAGFADERHLWPAAYHLISQCRPERVVGEQVASKDTDTWIDLVQTDLEALGYAFGCVPFPSAGVGAPHIRDRAYWVGNASSTGQGAVRPVAAAGESGGLADGSFSGQRQECADAGRQPVGDSAQGVAAGFEYGGVLGGLADTEHHERQGCISGRGLDSGAQGSGTAAEFARYCAAIGLDNTISIGRRQGRDGNHAENDGQQFDATSDGCDMDDTKSQRWGFCDTENIGQTHAQVNAPDDASRGAIDGCRPDDRIARPGPTNGHWAAADWLHCRDGKWRPVEPGTFPLAYGMPRSMGAMSPELRRLAELAELSGDSLKRAKQYRVQQLKGYGNAINAQAAQAFIEAVAA